MKTTALGVLLIGIVGLVGCAPSAPDARPGPPQPRIAYDGPAVADFSVWRPFIATGGQVADPDRVVATGFATSIPGRSEPVLVTVLHPAVGAERPLTDASLAAGFRQTIGGAIVSEAFGAGDDLRRLGDAVSLAYPDSDEAPPADDVGEPRSGPEGAGETAAEGDPIHDVLVFSGGESRRRLKPMTLSVSQPAPGDTLWMATAVYAGASPSRSGHQATVIGVKPDGQVTYRFKNPRLSLEATAGAPLLNPGGQVLGIHLGEHPLAEEVGGVGGVGLSLARVAEFWPSSASGQPAKDQTAKDQMGADQPDADQTDTPEEGEDGATGGPPSGG